VVLVINNDTKAPGSHGDQANARLNKCPLYRDVEMLTVMGRLLQIVEAATRKARVLLQSS